MDHDALQFHVYVPLIMYTKYINFTMIINVEESEIILSLLSMNVTYRCTLPFPLTGAVQALL